MSRRDRHLIAFAGVAASVCGAFWALWVVTASGAALVLALILHVTAAALTTCLVPSERRPLVTALGLVVPVLGPIAASLSTIVGGRGGAELLHDPHAIKARLNGAEIARRLTRSLPVCEALVSTNIEARRQALTKLKTRAAPEDIAVLRWARAQRGGDVAVEIALAFEEISARFEQRATAARAAVTATPSYASVSGLFRTLTAGITTGVVDPSLISRVAAEGCRSHATAIQLDPIRGRELLAERVRLELAIHRPMQALVLLSETDVKASTELRDIYREAAYAARRFDLVPETSYASV